MFRKRGPDKAFVHAEDCRILAADRTAQIQWSEVEAGHWEAICVCGTQHYYAPKAGRVRLDPLDPKTAHHLPQCEFASTTDPAVLRVLLKVQDREGYWWVQCGGCDAGWQVPHFAESVR